MRASILVCGYMCTQLVYYDMHSARSYRTYTLNFISGLSLIREIRLADRVYNKCVVASYVMPRDGQKLRNQKTRAATWLGRGLNEGTKSERSASSKFAPRRRASQFRDVTLESTYCVELN